MSCHNHCTTELWWNNSGFVGGTGTGWDWGYFQLRVAGSAPLGKIHGYLFPEIIPCLSSYAYLDAVLTDSKGSFQYISSVFAGFYSVQISDTCYSVQISEKFFSGLIS